MEYPGGAESASGWQYAKSEWRKSALGEHEELSSPEQGCSEKWSMSVKCDIDLYTQKWIWQS